MNCAKLLLAAACMLLMQSLSAQNPALKGYVYDSQTRRPLSGVSLKDIEGNLLCLSDQTGRFIAPLPEAGAITVSLIGYKEQQINSKGSVNELNIQLEANAINLNEVRITGFADFKKIRETPAAVSLLTTEDLQRGSSVSLQSALNTVPGVRMDQSTLSEARISIRGNGVRSAFGIRNVKIYVNEIPLTEADGTSRIEGVDVNSVGQAEIIRGPASSIYGAGTGGVINLSLQRAPHGEKSIEASGLAGSFGLARLASNYRSGGDNLNSFVSLGWQEFDGYRQHSGDLRRFITGNFQLFPDNKRVITVLLNRTSQDAQIPGSLSRELVAIQPQQANPTNLDKQAARYQNWTRVGIGQQYRLSDQLTNHTSVFTSFYDLDHPLPFAYIRNHYQSFGGRTRFSFVPEWKTLPTTFVAGMEYNQGLTKGTQYANVSGNPGAAMTNIDAQNTLYSLFYQSETTIGSKTSIVLGLGYNGLTYDIVDILIPSRSGIKRFKPQASPRLAVSHSFNSSLSVHGSYSTGFSPPTASEIRNADGSINTGLQAEKARNYEINIKGSLLKSALSFDLALYRQDLSGELIGQTVQQGITVYNNSGKTRHDGSELAVSWNVPVKENGYLSSVRPYIGLTYSDYTFQDYKIRNAAGQVVRSYDGNPLTGIAPWVVNAGIDLRTRSGLTLYSSLYYSDRLPVNDATTEFNGSYCLVNAKVAYRATIGKRFEAEIAGGAHNLINQNYSSIVSLNAAASGASGPAYYNPAPSRNFYGGLSLKYKIPDNE